MQATLTNPSAHRLFRRSGASPRRKPGAASNLRCNLDIGFRRCDDSVRCGYSRAIAPRTSRTICLRLMKPVAANAAANSKMASNQAKSGSGVT